MKTYRRILGYLRPYIWPRGVAAVLFMLCFSALEGSLPFFLRYTVKHVFLVEQPETAIGLGMEALRPTAPPGAGDRPSTRAIPSPSVPCPPGDASCDAARASILGEGMLWFVVMGVVVIGVLRGFLSYGGGYLTDWIGQRVITDMRNEVTRHMQSLDLAFYNRQRAGQIVSRVTADVTLVRHAVTDAVKSVFQELTTLIALCAAAIYMDPVLALLGLMFIPLAALPIRYLSIQMRLTTRKQQETTGRLNAMLHESVQGNRVIKVFGREEFEADRLRVQDERIFRNFMRASRIRSLPLTEVLAGFAVAATVWYGGSRVIADPSKGAELAAFLMALILLYDPFKKLVRANYTIQQGIAGAERAFGLLDRPSEVTDRPGAGALEGIRKSIVFDDVTFAYEPGEPVLRHVNLRIPVGQVVALVGMSGGGKSTLADLLPRLYDVTGGRITIDDVDVRDVTLASLRRQLAVVTQFTFLFNDTVRANIAFGEPDRPHDDIVAAARAANAHEFITALPQGYDTPIGDLGVRLSGGQRQRLAIARAILKNAPILILDEATSALDTESEGLVQEALERLMANRTSVVVAHRLSTIRNADLIVVLSHGRIVERGTHDELMARGGEYRKLYELQFGDADAAITVAAAAE